MDVTGYKVIITYVSSTLQMSINRNLCYSPVIPPCFATILGNTENVCPIYAQHFSAVILSFQKEVIPVTSSFLLMGLTVLAI